MHTWPPYSHSKYDTFSSTAYLSHQVVTTVAQQILHVYMYVQVQTFFRTETEYQRKPAFCIKLERVPGLSRAVKERVKCMIIKTWA